jgi:GAF domain-containing protein/CheY-like chemotaxis protein
MAVGTAAGVSVRALPSPDALCIPPFLLLTAIVVISLILCVWWIREHRVIAQRRVMRLLYLFTEELLAISPASEVHRRLAEVAPVIPGATGVRLYLANRSTGRLDCVAGQPAGRGGVPNESQKNRTPPRRVAGGFTGEPEPEWLSVHPESPSGSLAGGVALAYRSRGSVHIPDARRSPAIEWKGPSSGPRSMLFLPMIAQSEVLGVLEIYAERVRYFAPEERDTLQHLANQAAASLKRNEQQAAREQFHRSQKIEAQANVLSTVAGELRAPLENILLRSRKIVAGERDSPLRGELIALTEEAETASEIIEGLMSFGRAEPELSPIVEINGLLSGLIRLREREWKALGVDAQTRLSRTPLYTAGPQSQVEQVLLNVLAHAEKTIAAAPVKTLSLAASTQGKRAVIEIAYSCPEDASRNGRDSDGSGLRIWRAVVQGHDGDVRVLRPSSGLCRVEIDLPLSAADRQAARSLRACTALLVEPDPGFRGRLVKDLGSRGCRVVPVLSAEEALDLAQRLRFELVLCSARLPGLNWVEFFERVRELAGVFVLMLDGIDAAHGSAFEAGEGLVLRKSTYDAEIERVFAEVEARSGQA